MKKTNSHHEFALYVQELSNALTGYEGSKLTIADEALAHRLQHVLRAEPGQEFTLFNQDVQAQCILEGYLKRAVVVHVQSKRAPELLKPEVVFLLPVLKKEAFETALYSLVESGATTIQPVITRKIHRQWITDKDVERLQRIIIAAAEQAKQFSRVQLLKPQELSQLLSQSYAGQSIFFDPAGESLISIIETVRSTKPQQLRLLIGPEADLTDEEKELVKKNGFLFCALTPTILRASSAAALAQGIFRSIL